jgi:hypothetical protein
MVDRLISSVEGIMGQLTDNLVSKQDALANPFSMFILAIRSPVTREKYLQRIGYFFDFLEILKIDDSGNIISIEKRFNAFSLKAKEDTNWLINSIVRYLQFHRQRVYRRDNRFDPEKLHQANQVILRTNGY